MESINKLKEYSYGRYSFTQISENDPAELVLVHQPAQEIFMSMLHPAASLYDNVTNQSEVAQCFKNLSDILFQHNIQMLDIRDVLKLCKEGLLNLALSALTYECSNIEEGSENPDFQYYISDEYKRSVLEKLNPDQLVDVVLLRPAYTLKYVPRNTYVEPVNISFRPLGNLLFVRDQQITTQKGVIIGRTSAWAREMEHQIMKQVYKNLKVDILSELPQGMFLEGGDFYVAKPDLSMVGIGIRTNFEAAFSSWKMTCLVPIVLPWSLMKPIRINNECTLTPFLTSFRPLIAF